MPSHLQDELDKEYANFYIAIFVFMDYTKGKGKGVLV